MIRINQIKIKVCKPEDKRAKLESKIRKIIKTDNFKIDRIVKESIDARDKADLRFIFSVDINSSDEELILKKNSKNKDISKSFKHSYKFPYTCDVDTNKNYKRPIIIGAGPAGYFCGLKLAQAGFKPIIIERGSSVEKRTIDVEKFWERGTINPNSNVSFGEGGAGTFSDGKLTTGIKDKAYRIDEVLADFIKFGANEEIAYVNKPHIGTDVLKTIMINMRHEIESCGGTILFDTLLTDICFSGIENKVEEITLDISNNVEIDGILPSICNEYEYIYKDGKTLVKLKTNLVVLAIGHSSRDTFRVLNSLNVPMESKAFAIGVRIEHKADMINKSSYGESNEASYLNAASYKMTFRSSEGRSVYSFCMCPGGYVVNASSDIDQSVVNGMSYSRRDGQNSNSAIVVNVTPEDFRKEGFDKYGVLAGVYFQEKYEKLAYEEGKSFIPIQKYYDFKMNKTSESIGEIQPNIKGNYTFGNLNNCLPEYVRNAIIEGIEYYSTKLDGFNNNDSILSGIESRTSSPVRIKRNEDNMSEFNGLFPCGEGAGYAGGITSAAVDGIKVAESCALYINNYKGQK